VGRIMSTQRTPKIPGSDHPITLEPASTRVVVRLGERTIADSRRAIAMREMDYPVVHYIPRSDVDMSLLERTTHTSY
jgi:uncharacterized protein (DUF427 family)